VSRRTYLVTGHKGKLGNDFCYFLLNQGINVVGFDIGVEENKSTYDDNFFWEINVDVTKEASISKAVKKLKSEKLSVSSFVHFAARNPTLNDLIKGYDLRNQDVAQIQNYLEVGTLGALRTLQSIYDQLENDSSVLLIGSDLSLISPNQSLYCVCSSEDSQKKHLENCPVKPIAYSIDKSALVGITRYLATLYAKSEKAIRVNCACIGAVDFGFDPTFKKELSSLIPLGRPANPGEYNEVFLFLTSKQSSYITGSIIACDGGRTSW
jgi:NAD(P)-dependent dehydrogenase (short-subunit alcohol dehydrogenase family)